MCKENPHRKKRKEQEKLREAGDLTPLDARNSLLSGPYGNDGKGQYQKAPVADQFYFNDSQGAGSRPASGIIPMQHMRNASEASGRPLVVSAAPIGGSSPPQQRSPLVYDYQRQPPPQGPYEGYRGQYQDVGDRGPYQDVGVARRY